MPAADTVTDRGRPRGPTRCLAAAATVVGAALLIAGCGGSSSPGVASIGGSNTTGSSQQSAPSSGGGAVASGSSAPTPAGGGGPQSGFAISGGSRQSAEQLSVCMRANGVPNFPDPNSQGVIQGSGIDPNSPAFQSAQQKCAKYTPNGGKKPSPAQQAAMRAQALRFSACMRSHGVTNFPDPQFGSGGSVRITIHASGPAGGGGGGLDPNSPIFQAAQKACGSLLPGAKAGAPPVALGARGR